MTAEEEIAQLKRLFDLPKKLFDFPPAAIQLSDRLGAPKQIVGQESHLHLYPVDLH